MAAARVDLQRTAIAYAITQLIFHLQNAVAIGASTSAGPAVLFAVTGSVPIAISGALLFFLLGRSPVVAWALVFGLWESVWHLLPLALQHPGSESAPAHAVGALSAALVVFFLLAPLARARGVAARLGIALAVVAGAEAARVLVYGVIAGEAPGLPPLSAVAWIAIEGVVLFVGVQLLTRRRSTA